MPIEVYSFFSGVGFLDLGFENVGFDVVFVDEHDERFLQSYRYASFRNMLKTHFTAVLHLPREENFADMVMTRRRRD